MKYEDDFLELLNSIITDVANKYKCSYIYAESMVLEYIEDNKDSLIDDIVSTDDDEEDDDE